MRSKILIAVVASSILLSGCNAKFLPVRTEYKIIEPDARLYQCDDTLLPDPETLTDIQVAALVNDLKKNNRICKNNMTAIQEFFAKAKEIIEDRKKK